MNFINFISIQSVVTAFLFFYFLVSLELEQF